MTKMTEFLSLEGSMAGKNVFVYSYSRIMCQANELRNFLGGFELFNALYEIGKLHNILEKKDREFFGLPPIPKHALPYLAMLILEEGKIASGKKMGFTALEAAGEMFTHLADPLFSRTDERDTAKNEGAETIKDDVKNQNHKSEEYLIRSATQSLGYQRELRHRIPRMHLILKHIWPTVTQAKAINPLNVLLNTIGLELDEILRFGLLFYGRASHDPFVQAYSQTKLDASGKLAQKLFPLEKQHKFLEWISTDYQKFRDLAQESGELDQYRFNPLRMFPAVRLNKEGKPDLSRYMVPCARLLYERTTDGLYFFLSDQCRTENKNPFTSAFGYVFQEYVGFLLKKAFGDSRVYSEWKYRWQKNTVDTPDWILLDKDNRRAVIMEVKQSAIFFQSKLTGSRELIKADLEQTLSKAARQLVHFASAIAQKTQGLEKLFEVKSFEYLIITYDSLYYSNSFIKEIITETGAVNLHFHVISIEELEYLLGYCWGGSLFKLLNRKRATFDESIMDFRDWMGNVLSKQHSKHENTFLSNYWKNLEREWGLEKID